MSKDSISLLPKVSVPRKKHLWRTEKHRKIGGVMEIIGMMEIIGVFGVTEIFESLEITEIVETVGITEKTGVIEIIRIAGIVVLLLKPAGTDKIKVYEMSTVHVNWILKDLEGPKLSWGAEALCYWRGKLSVTAGTVPGGSRSSGPS